MQKIATALVATVAVDALADTFLDTLAFTRCCVTHDVRVDVVVALSFLSLLVITISPSTSFFHNHSAQLLPLSFIIIFFFFFVFCFVFLFFCFFVCFRTEKLTWDKERVDKTHLCLVERNGKAKEGKLEGAQTKDFGIGYCNQPRHSVFKSLSGGDCTTNSFA